MHKMGKIIVTGGAGYIGSHTIIELLENTNYEIISIDNFSNSSSTTYDRIEKITGTRIKAYNVDLCNKNETELIFQSEKEIIGIIHFAAFKSVPESVSNPFKYYYNNVNSLINLIELSLKYKVKNFIFSSSCSVYGNIEIMPVSEETPLNKAVSPYAYTKQIGEQILKDYTNIHQDLNVIALRYFNPAGAHISGINGENPINPPTSLVPVIMRTAVGKMKEMSVFGSDYETRDGTCIRDYVHVSDIADAHVLALEHLVQLKNKSNYDIINLGSGKGVSVFEAIESFERTSGLKLTYKIVEKRVGDVEAIYSDSSRAEFKLFWKPKYSLDEIMSSAWAWEGKLNIKNK
jgi:UDP-glucose 4-epimerase